MSQPISVELQQRIVNNMMNRFLECEHLHEGTCEERLASNVYHIMKALVKIYLPIHLIPLLIYKRKQLKTKPFTVTGRAVFNFVKSLCFGSFMSGLLVYFLCKEMRRRKTLDGWVPLVSGWLGSISLMLESTGRRNEITLFVMPRGLETLLNLFVKYGYLPRIKHGEVLVFAMILAVIHYYYQHEPKSTKETVRKAFRSFWGVN